MKIKAVVIVLSLLAFFSLGSALSADLELVEREAKVDDPAQFRLNMHNNISNATTFQINYVTAPSEVEQWIEYPRYMEVGPSKTRGFLINVTPSEIAVQGNYRFNINIRNVENQKSFEVSDYFSVGSDKDIRIVSYNVSKKSIKPGEKVSSSITLKNTAPRTIDNFQIRAEFLNQSSMKEGYELPSGAKLTNEFTLSAPENVRPGERQYKLSLNSSDQHEEVSQSVRVEEIKDIRRDSESQNYLLYSVKEVSAINRGNKKVETKLNVSIPSYLSALTVFSTEPDEVDETDGKTVYSWNVGLEPDEKSAYSYKTQYWIPLLILVVLLVLFWVLKALQNPIKLSKSSSSTDEGVKVRIEVENSSNKSVKNLKITDYIPEVISLKREFDMAKPIVRKTKEYTELEWEIQSMKPGEQRVLEYFIRPSVVVEGDITLPAAEVEKNGNNVSETSKVNAEFESED